MILVFMYHVFDTGSPPAAPRKNGIRRATVPAPDERNHPMTHTSMSRWNPQTRTWFGDRDPFTALVEGLFNGELGRGEELSNRTWRPAVDIRETDDAYMVNAELPGLTREDINITIENNVLKLTGERRFEKDVKEEEFHRIERAYGSFTRAFSLPSRVDPVGIEASSKDGILTVRVPKAAEARPRKIDIS